MQPFFIPETGSTFQPVAGNPSIYKGGQRRTIQRADWPVSGPNAALELCLLSQAGRIVEGSPTVRRTTITSADVFLMEAPLAMKRLLSILLAFAFIFSTLA